LKMDAKYFFETSVNFQHTTRGYIPENKTPCQFSSFDKVRHTSGIIACTLVCPLRGSHNRYGTN
jgi:hypothetical protein